MLQPVLPLKHPQQGSILIEALIAFLIFSVGILGVIGLQASTINTTLEARYRTDAAFLANQMIAQIWADGPANLSGYDCGSACLSTNSNAKISDWVKQIQPSSTVPGFLPGVSDNTNEPTILVNATTSTVSRNFDPVLCDGSATATLEPNQVMIVLCWKSPQQQQSANSHSFTASTQVQFN